MKMGGLLIFEWIRGMKSWFSCGISARGFGASILSVPSRGGGWFLRMLLDFVSCLLFSDRH